MRASHGDQVDVLVVGAGPAGGSAARRLSGTGLTVLVVDRKKSTGEPLQCAEFVPLPALQYQGLTPCVVQRIGGMQTILPGGAVCDTDLQGVMLDRVRMDHTILQDAIRRGAGYRPGTSLIHLDHEKKSATIRSRGDMSATTHEIRYKILIAADGAMSRVGALLHLPPLPLLHTRQYTVSLQARSDKTRIWLSRDYPGGYAWLFPKGDSAHLGVGLERNFTPASQRNLRHVLDHLHGQLVADGLLGRHIDYQTGGALPVGGIRDPLVVHDILFAGDAAGLAHPVSGAGIVPAMQSGELAADAVLAHLDGEQNALPGYGQEIDMLFQGSWQHALQQRDRIKRSWRDVQEDDHLFRQGWIAFDEYYRAMRDARVYTRANSK